MFEERWDLVCKEEDKWGVIEARAAIFLLGGEEWCFFTLFLSMNWSEMKLKHLVWSCCFGGEVRVGHGDCGYFRLNRIRVSGGGLRDAFFSGFPSSSFPCFWVHSDTASSFDKNKFLVYIYTKNNFIDLN